MGLSPELLKIKDRLRGKVLIVGIGNPLRGDDAFGPEVIKRLPPKPPHLFINVETVPENHLETMISFSPDTLLLIDAIDWDSKPGELKVAESEEIGAESISTHNISLGFLMDYLAQQTGADVLLLGVRPKQVRIGEKISPIVAKRITEVVEFLQQHLP